MNTRTALTALTALVTLSLPAAAQDAVALTVEEVLNSTETANPTIESQALTLKNARVSYESSMASSDARIDQMNATLAWHHSQLTFRQGKVAQLLSVAEAYVQLQQENENLGILEARLQLAQEDLKSAVERVAIGAASPVDELQARVSLLSAELNLASARNTRQFTTLPIFAETTGIDEEMLDTASLASEPPELSSLGTLDSYLTTTGRRAENDFAARQLKIDELNLELLSSTSTSSLDLQKATNTVNGSTASVASTSSNLESATASAFANAQQAFGTTTLRELQLELQAENTRRTQQQHAAGLLTDSQLASSELDLITATDSLRAARWSAYFAWIRVANAAGTDLLAIWDAR